MLPTAPPAGTSDLPADAAYWAPHRNDLHDEGFGFFRDTWTIIDVPAGSARELVEEERQIADAIGALADNAEHFDDLSRAVEANDLDEADITTNEYRVLDKVLHHDEPPLGCLEVGVAGLVYALASVRIVPAASCRGHANAHRWSAAPVVYFAASTFRAQALQRLAAKAGCTFMIDGSRAELIVVRGRSIANTMSLAEAILENRDSFVQHRQPRKPRPKVEQFRLF